MEPVIGIETLLLRTQLPEVTLRPGTSVVARVLSRGESHGVLVIAGIPLSALLPAEVGKTGDTLRLTVSDVTPERVTLQLDQLVNPPPSRRRSRRSGPKVRSRRSRGPSRRRRGALDGGAQLHLDRAWPARSASGARRHAHQRGGRSAGGRSFALADAAAGRLQDGLHARTGLDASVEVTPRREPLDLYA